MQRFEPRAWVPLNVRGRFRVEPDDFQVEEQLAPAFSGRGEHLYLWVEKRGANTRWVADELAGHFGIPALDVSFAGQKDRHALTWQWFSVRLPGLAEQGWPSLPELPGVRILAQHWHDRKLRPGDHTGNRFQIRIRDLQGDLAGLQQRILAWQAGCCVPNYFGPQRFGHDGSNLIRAEAWLTQGGRRPARRQKGMLLSSARSLLFNQVLGTRVALGNWRAPLPGDVLLDGVPTGPMWGRGRAPVSALAARLEAQALSGFAAWREGLEHQGLKQERRALVLAPAAFSAQVQGPELLLGFTLGTGEFATAVLRELGDFSDARSPAE